MWMLRRVVGDSMLPTLKAGDIVIAKHKQPQVGDIVIADIGTKEVIKRIVSIDAVGYELRGDNISASTDSRIFGKIQQGSIKGVVFKTIKGK